MTARLGPLAVVCAVLVAVHLLAAPPAGATIPGAGVVTNVAGGVVGGVAGFAFDKVAEGIAGWVLGAVGAFVDGVLDYLTSTARPDVGAVWFAGPDSPYATVRNLAGVLLVAFVLLAIIHALVHGDVAGMVRRVALGVPLAVVGMVVTTAVAGQLIELTDGLSSAVLASSDDQALHFLSGFGMMATSATRGFAAVVLGLVAVVAALLLWVELLVRSALVYLLVAVSPLGFAAAVWPTARGFLRRTVEILLAVIVSKFVICVALSIGVAALAGAGQAGRGHSVAGAAGTSVAALLTGAVLLGLAAFAPFLVMKLVPIAEAALLAQGISRSPARAAQSGVSTWSSARMVSRLSGSGAGTPSSASTHSRAAGPDQAAASGPPPADSGRGPSGAGPAAGPAAAASSAASRARAAGRVVQDAARTATGDSDPPRKAADRGGDHA